MLKLIRWLLSIKIVILDTLRIPNQSNQNADIIL